MIVRPVADGVEVLAPAKLNLFLEILGRRPDGYHELESVMVAVDLYDRLHFAVDPSGAIVLREASPERLQIVANVLSKSLILSHYETRIADAFDQIEPLAARLQQSGRTGSQAKRLLQQIGGVLLTQHRMVGRVEMQEKPDVLWDHPELERLYARLEDEYELAERGLALERKLALINDTVGAVLDLIQDQRSLRLEYYIIGLIVIEILLTLGDMALRLGK